MITQSETGQSHPRRRLPSNSASGSAGNGRAPTFGSTATTHFPGGRTRVRLWMTSSGNPFGHCGSGPTSPATASKPSRAARRYATRWSTGWKPSCLKCHNDPATGSPKTDWRVGDLRGVLEVIRPLDDIVAQAVYESPADLRSHDGNLWARPLGFGHRDRQALRSPRIAPVTMSREPGKPSANRKAKNINLRTAVAPKEKGTAILAQRPVHFRRGRSERRSPGGFVLQWPSAGPGWGLILGQFGRRIDSRSAGSPLDLHVSSRNAWRHGSEFGTMGRPGSFVCRSWPIAR